MTVAVAAARTITVTVTSSHQESKVLPVVMIMQVGHVVSSVNDAAMLMALISGIRALMMQDFNVPFMKTRSPKQYCKAPCRLLMGRLPWARASRTRLRPCG